MAMTEEALHDSQGVLVTDSTWNYTIPSATCIPRELHVRLLEVWEIKIATTRIAATATSRCQMTSSASASSSQNSDNTRGVYSSKACGEPPLQLSASVMTAMQDAVRAGRLQLQELGRRARNGNGNGVGNGHNEKGVVDWGPPATLTRLHTVLDYPVPLYDLL